MKFDFLQTRILSVFNLLKRVGFAILLVGGTTSYGQDWETPIRLTYEQTIWNSPPALLVDDSLNLHVFAIRINDSLRESNHWIVYHSLYYAKYDNWGRILQSPIELYHPVDPASEAYGPTAVLDSRGHIHVFWGEYDNGGECSDCLFYTQMSINGEFIVEPRPLEHSNFIAFAGYTFNAVEARDGNIWVTQDNWVIGVSPEGHQITDALEIANTGVVKPWLAAGPDSSVWVGYRSGVWPDGLSIRRMDRPGNTAIQILHSTPENPLEFGFGNFVIDDSGAMHFLVLEHDSAYILKISADGLLRDSIAFAPADWWLNILCRLTYLPPDTLLLIYEYDRTSIDNFNIVRYSLNTEVIGTPEVFHLTGFGTTGRSLLTAKRGGYWLPGGGSVEPGYNYLSMLHIPGPEEPLSIVSSIPVADKFELSAFPNPFNSTISISLDLPLHQEVTVSLYDLLGREVDVVYRGRLSSNTIPYVAPAAMASGVYFLRASAGDVSVLGKVVLLK